MTELAEEVSLYRQAQPDVLIFRDEGEEPTVEGRIVPYGEWSEVDTIVEGHFLESFAPGAFKKTLTERAKEMRVYFEHGRSKIFDSQPIAVLREAWEADDGLYFKAGLLDGLPDLFLNGLRRKLYGASIGAKVVKADRVRNPERSERNPDALEERTYREMAAFDFSITPRPHYAGAVTLRSIADDFLLESIRARHPEYMERNEEAPPTEEPTEETEPQHSGREEPEPAVEEPEPQRSRSTQSHDYLTQKEAEPKWLLKSD